MIRCSLNLVVMLDMCRAHSLSVRQHLLPRQLYHFRIESNANAKHRMIKRRSMYTSACLAKTKTKQKKNNKSSEYNSVCVFFLLNVEMRFSRYERRFRRHKIYVSCVKRTLYLNVASVYTSASSHSL